eukprot:4745087-Amphidinium_carterae.1
MHEIEGPGLEATVLGADLGGAKGCCRRTAPKLWKHRAALRELVGRGFGSGRQFRGACRSLHRCLALQPGWPICA